MILLSLPYFYENFHFNNYFNYFIKSHPEAKKCNYGIEYTYGSYNFNYWNGDLNSNYLILNKLLLEEEFINCPNSSSIPLRYDFSNVLLQKQDYDDVHANTILKNSENGSTILEISNLELMEYISNKYPEYYFIFSSKSDLMFPFNKDILNSILEETKISRISLPSYYNYSDLLNEINFKNKVEILVGNKCKCDSEKIKQCIYQENQFQYNFSGKTIYNCEKCYNYDNYQDLLEEITYFSKKGFNHFKIDSPPKNKLKEFNLWLMFSLIKPDYIASFLKEGGYKHV